MNEPVPPPGPSPKPEPPLSGELYCLGCGARNDAGAVECWLCSGRSLSKAGPGARPPEQSPPRGPFITVGGLMLVIASLATCLGIYSNAPGLLPLAWITFILALVVVRVEAVRRRQGEPTSGAGRFSFLMLFSILAPMLILGAAIVALFIHYSMGPR